MKKSNVRVLTKTLAVVSILAPTGGHALGIGDIRLHSALNQNLDAEISLTLSGESLSDIKVNLAPSEKFDEAGVSWVSFLSKIKFETITQANGSAVIKLTSKEAIKEPFLDFLLEVSWPKGVLYREFTVLVDPPSDYKQVTIPVSTSTESYAQSPGNKRQVQPYAAGQIGEGGYGPTLASDTLWSVAERTKGQGVSSVEQMMIAIYQANPQAFYKGNVNALLAGKMLTIPEPAVVLKLSRNQALAEFDRQTKAWKSHSVPSHTETEKPSLNKVERFGDNQLTLAAPAKEGVQGHSIAPVKEQKTPETSTVVKEMAKDKSIQGATPGIDADMLIKVAALEKQLAMLQQMILLKDQQLAALQNQSQAKSLVTEHPTSGEDAKPAAQTVPAPQPAQPEIVIAKPASPVTPVPQQVVKPPVIQPEPEAVDLYYLVVGGVGSVVLTLLGWLWLRKRKVDKQTNTESMFASSSMIKTPESFTQSVSKGDEHISVPTVEEGAAADHDAGTVGESSFLSEFTPSDFDSFDTDQGEIDPISEADVYLAYGRYQQAEELIRQAIKDQPNRDECKLKLLEIFYADEDKTAFEAYATELAKAGKQNEAVFWEKVAEMGREICADSPLFSSGGDSVIDGQSNNEDIDLSSFSMKSDEAEQLVSAADTQANKLLETQVEHIDFDLSSFSMEKDDVNQGVVDSNAKTLKSSAAQVGHIDFDLNSFSIASDSGVIAAHTQADKSAGEKLEQIDFDLSSFSMDTDESDEETEFKAPSALSDNPSGINKISKEQEFESYEFDFSSDHAESTGIDDLDFSELESAAKNDQDIDFYMEKPLDLNDDLDGDFDFNFDLPITTSEQSSNQHDEFGVSDLTDMDELETKLDLAKAYVDMGDEAAAKDLAREVLEHGSDEQQKVAQMLLDELS